MADGSRLAGPSYALSGGGDGAATPASNLTGLSVQLGSTADPDPASQGEALMTLGQLGTTPELAPGDPNRLLMSSGLPLPNYAPPPLGIWDATRGALAETIRGIGTHDPEALGRAVDFLTGQPIGQTSQALRAGTDIAAGQTSEIPAAFANLIRHENDPGMTRGLPIGEGAGWAAAESDLGFPARTQPAKGPDYAPPAFAAPLAAQGEANVPVNPGFASQVALQVPQLAEFAGLAAVPEVGAPLAAAAMGGQGIVEQQEKAEKAGLAGTPEAYRAEALAGGLQGGLALAPLGAATGALLPAGLKQTGLNVLERLGFEQIPGWVARGAGELPGGALFGAGSTVASNLATQQLNPKQDLFEGVVPGSAQMAAISLLTGIAHGHGEAPVYTPKGIEGPAADATNSYLQSLSDAHLAAANAADDPMHMMAHLNAAQALAGKTITPEQATNMAATERQKGWLFRGQPPVALTPHDAAVDRAQARIEQIDPSAKPPPESEFAPPTTVTTPAVADLNQRLDVLGREYAAMSAADRASPLGRAIGVANQVGGVLGPTTMTGGVEHTPISIQTVQAIRAARDAGRQDVVQAILDRGDRQAATAESDPEGQAFLAQQLHTAANAPPITDPAGDEAYRQAVDLVQGGGTPHRYFVGPAIGISHDAAEQHLREMTLNGIVSNVDERGLRTLLPPETGGAPPPVTTPPAATTQPTTTEPPPPETVTPGAEPTTTPTVPADINPLAKPPVDPRDQVTVISHYNPQTRGTYYGVSINGRTVVEPTQGAQKAWELAHALVGPFPADRVIDTATVGPVRAQGVPDDPQHAHFGPADLPREGALSLPAIHQAYFAAYGSNKTAAGHGLAFQAGALGAPLDPALSKKFLPAYMAGSRYRDMAINAGAPTGPAAPVVAPRPAPVAAAPEPTAPPPPTFQHGDTVHWTDSKGVNRQGTFEGTYDGHPIVRQPSGWATLQAGVDLQPGPHPDPNSVMVTQPGQKMSDGTQLAGMDHPLNWPADVPPMVYHGYGRPDQASAYNSDFHGMTTPILGPGRYFAFNKADAGEFGPNVENELAPLKNPVVIRSDADWRNLTEQAGWDFAGMPQGEDIENLHYMLLGRGYDGAIVHWDDNTETDKDSRGNWIKLLRNTFGTPQAVDFTRTAGPAEIAAKAAAPLPEPEPKPAPTDTTPAGGGAPAPAQVAPTVAGTPWDFVDTFPTPQPGSETVYANPNDVAEQRAYHDAVAKRLLGLQLQDRQLTAALEGGYDVESGRPLDELKNGAKVEASMKEDQRNAAGAYHGSLEAYRSLFGADAANAFRDHIENMFAGHTPFPKGYERAQDAIREHHIATALGEPADRGSTARAYAGSERYGFPGADPTTRIAQAMELAQFRSRLEAENPKGLKAIDALPGGPRPGTTGDIVKRLEAVLGATKDGRSRVAEYLGAQNDEMRGYRPHGVPLSQQRGLMTPYTRDAVDAILNPVLARPNEPPPERAARPGATQGLTAADSLVMDPKKNAMGNANIQLATDANGQWWHRTTAMHAEGTGLWPDHHEGPFATREEAIRDGLARIRIRMAEPERYGHPSAVEKSQMAQRAKFRAWADTVEAGLAKTAPAAGQGAATPAEPTVAPPKPGERYVPIVPRGTEQAITMPIVKTGMARAQIQVGQGADGKWYAGHGYELGAETGAHIPIGLGPYDTRAKAIFAAGLDLHASMVRDLAHYGDRATPGMRAAAERIGKWLATVDPDKIPQTSTSAHVVGAEPERQPLDYRPGAAGTISVPGRPDLAVQYGLAEAGDLTASNNADFSANPEYPAELQPRQRDRGAMRGQIAAMLNPEQFRPGMLGASTEIGTGAPMVGPDGVVESGNGRVMALRQMYAEGGPAAQAYRDYLESQGHDTSGMKQPVLVRVRQTPLTRAELIPYLQDANTSAIARMGAGEQAKVDASKLTGEVLDSYRGGSLTNVENVPFVRAVLGQIASPAELNQLVDAKGALSAEGVRRLQAAFTAKAYGDNSLVQAMFENPNPDMGTLGKAAVAVAPQWAMMREAAARGVIDPGLDPTDALNTAFSLVRQQREGAVNLADKYSSIDAFSDEDPRVERFLRLFYQGDGFRRVRAGDNIARDLQDYTAMARAQATNDMFMAPAHEMSTAFLNGLIERANTAKAKGQPELTLDEQAPGALYTLPGRDEPEGETPDQLDLTTWHGSRHLFGQPDDRFIGEGEGNQTYGYGHYSAGNLATAETYRNAGGDRRRLDTFGTEGEPWHVQQLVEKARNHLDITTEKVSDITPEAVAGAVGQRLDKIWPEHVLRDPGAQAQIAQHVADVADRVRRGEMGVRATGTDGNIYRWEVPAHDEFIDHDLALSEQSPKVREAMQRISDQIAIARRWGYSLNEVRSPNRVDRMAELLGTMKLGSRERPDIMEATSREGHATGSDFYQELAHYASEHITEGRTKATGPREATRVLREEGVAGLSYLDHRSRDVLNIDKFRRQVVAGEKRLREYGPNPPQNIIDQLSRARFALEYAEAIKNPTWNYVTFDPSRIQAERVEEGEHPEPATLEDREHPEADTLERPEPDPLVGRGRRRPAGTIAEAQARGVVGFTSSKIKRVDQMAHELGKLLGVPIRVGRMGGGTLGYFVPSTGETKVKWFDEYNTVAHELGHALELRDRGLYPELNKAIKAHAGELRPIDYIPNRANKTVGLHEGFAEFFRYYMTNQNHVLRETPNFYKAFEAALAKDNPKLLAGLREIQKDYHDFLASGPTEHRNVLHPSEYMVKKGPAAWAAMAKDAASRPMGWIGELADEAYRRYIDHLNPLKIARNRLMAIRAHNLGYREDLPAWRDPYKQAQMGVDAYSAAHADLVYGVHKYHTNELANVPQGAPAPGTAAIPDRPASSLYAALEHAVGRPPGVLTPGARWDINQLAEFGHYLVARRSVQLWDRYNRKQLRRPPDGLSATSNKNAVIWYEQHNPTWAKAAEMVYEYNRALWDKRLDSGQITAQIHRLGIEMNPDHVPFARTRKGRPGGSGGEGDVGGSGGGNLRHAGGAHAITGDFGAVINPIQTIMEQTHALHQFMAQNDVNRALFKLADEAGTRSSDILTRVPTTTRAPVQVDALEAFKTAAIAAGADPNEIAALGQDIESLLAGETTATMWRTVDAKETRTPTIYAWVNGQRIAGELADSQFGHQLRNVLDGMDRDSKNLLVSVLRGTTTSLRAGVVTHPTFILANYIRGEIADALNTNVGFIPFWHGGQGAWADITQSDLTRRYAAARGIVGGTVVASMDKARTQKSISALNRGRVQIRRVSSLSGLMHLTEISETANRLGIFLAGSKYFQNRGMTPWQADQEAAFEARDARNYARRGAHMGSISKIAAFLNASVQGAEKYVRTGTGDYNIHNLAMQAMGWQQQRALTGQGKPAPAGPPPLPPGARKPTFSNLTPNESRQLTQTIRAYTFLTAAGLLYAGYKYGTGLDKDPEYQNVPPEIRGSHWVFKGPGGDMLVVPKPFEGSIVLDAIERAFEYAATQNPEILPYLGEDLERWIFPPVDIPALSMVKQLATNRDDRGAPFIQQVLTGKFNQGAPIIPESKMGLDPQFQTNSYTSYLAKVVGAGLHVAPADIDVMLSGVLGNWGQTIEHASNVFEPGRPKRADTPENNWITGRFLKDPDRNALPTRVFWDNMAQNGGTLAQVKATVDNLRTNGDTANLITYVNGLPPAEKQYAELALIPGGYQEYHPMNRAAKVVAQVGDIRRELEAGELTTLQGQRIRLTPEQIVVVDRALEHYAVGEMGDALTLIGQKGWVQKPLAPYADLRQGVMKVSPAVARTLQQRMAMAGILLGEQNMAAWQKIAPHISDTYQKFGPAKLAEAGRLNSPQGMIRQIELNAANSNAPDAPDEAPPAAPEPAAAEPEQAMADTGGAEP
jgi:hypothetical protein